MPVVLSIVLYFNIKVMKFTGILFDVSRIIDCENRLM